MFTQFLKPRAARRKVIVWGLGFAALFGIATLSSSASIAANAPCVESKSAWNKGQQIDSFTDIGACDWTVPAGITSIEADLVGGGGGGGLSQFVGSGGGGGGQVVHLRNMTVTANAVLPVVVGDGAVQRIASDITLGLNGADGSPSTFLGYSAAGGLGGKGRNIGIGKRGLRS